MAKKKKPEDAPKGSPAWMATFSDLMNLLLCFFVLLFSMSSVDESKAEALIKSLADTFSIFSGGGSSFDSGVLVSNGANQLSQLDEYFSTMGQTSEGDNEHNPNQSQQGGESDDNLDPGVSPTPTPSYEEIEKEENKAQSGLLYDEVVGLADQYNLGDYLEIGVDAEYYRYVQIEISGAVLFDPGEAELKESAKPIISRLRDILKQYSGYKIEIIGHTDNVPQANTQKFKNNRHLSAARALAVADYLIGEKEPYYLDDSMVYYSGRGESEPIASNETEEGRAKNRRVEIRLYNLKNSED